MVIHQELSAFPLSEICPRGVQTKVVIGSCQYFPRRKSVEKNFFSDFMGIWSTRVVSGCMENKALLHWVLAKAMWVGDGICGICSRKSGPFLAWDTLMCGKREKHESQFLGHPKVRCSRVLPSGNRENLVDGCETCSWWATPMLQSKCVSQRNPKSFPGDNSQPQDDNLHILRGFPNHGRNAASSAMWWDCWAPQSQPSHQAARDGHLPSAKK